MAWYWLSFADGDLPEGSQFLGAVIVNGDVQGAADAALRKLMISGTPAFADDDDAAFASAVETARRLGVNPGGECQGMPIPDEMAITVPERWVNRLLSREECAAFDAEMERLRDA